MTAGCVSHTVQSTFISRKRDLVVKGRPRAAYVFAWVRTFAAVVSDFCGRAWTGAMRRERL
jgi:hypothetical protein